MSKSLISTGTTPNDGNGDTLLAGAGKINSNFNEIYSSLGNGSDLNIGVGRTVISTNSSGNVGIGTTNSGNKLTVTGTTSLQNLTVSGVSTLTSLVGSLANVTTATVTSLSGTNLNYTGISTVGSLSIGSTQVVSSARQLQNIASLDATTKATIESAISTAPNTFTDLSVSGLSTFTSGPVIVGSGSSTGTVSQPLQVTGGAYVSGNLGIGTTNPATQLQISSTQPTIRFNETDATSNNRNWNVTAWNQEFYWQGIDDAGSGGNNLFAITRSGNQIQAFEGRNAGLTWFDIDNANQRVGIGTSIPANQLHIQSIQPTIRFNESDAPLNNKNWNVTVWNQEFYWQALDDASSGGGNLFAMTRSGNQIQSFDGRTNGVTWFKVDNSNQRVGIGITNPANKFMVGGETVQFPQSLQVLSTLHPTSRRASIGLGGTLGSQSPDWQIAMDTNGNGTKDFGIFSTALNSSQFRIDTIGNTIIAPTFGSLLVGTATSTGTANQDLQVNGGGYVSGNLGVAHTNPTSRLDVVGDGNFTGVVTASSFSGSFSGNASTATYATSAGISTNATNVIGGIALVTQLQSTGVSTFTNGPVFVGAAVSTGTPAQPLQVTGGAYVSGNLGVGAVNPNSFVHIGAGSTTRSQLEFTSGSLLTSPSAGVVEYDGTTFFATPSTSFGRSSIPTTVYTSGAGIALTTTGELTPQILFPAANDTITLPIGTYSLTFGITFTRAATSTTSASLNVTLNGFGSGSAGTFSGMAVGGVGAAAAVQSAITLASSSITSSIPITIASNVASGVYTAMFAGILRITTAGTFQPKYNLSASLVSATGSNTLSAANYMMLQSLNSSGTSVSTGAWA